MKRRMHPKPGETLGPVNPDTNIGWNWEQKNIEACFRIFTNMIAEHRGRQNQRMLEFISGHVENKTAQSSNKNKSSDKHNLEDFLLGSITYVI